MDKHERQYFYEKQWIGIIIKDHTLFEDKAVNATHFHNMKNKQAFTLIERLLREQKALDHAAFITLNENELKKIGGLEHIEACAECVVKADIDTLKRIEKELQTYTIAKTMLEEVKTIATSETLDLEACRTIAENINEAVANVKGKRMNFSQLLYETRYSLLTMEEGFSGIDTGYESLNQAFDGWQQKDLILVGARPSMGKTALTINFALRAAKQGALVLYIPAETGEGSIVKRAVAIMGNLPVNVMRNPSKFLDAKGIQKYHDTFDALDKLPMHIEELHDIREIKQLVREKRRENPTQKILVVVDHLGHLSNGTVYQSRTIEFEEYCKQLKDIAKQYNVAMMLLSQLSRTVEQRNDKRPMSSDLRDSGAIEQIADVIAFLYRDNYYKKDHLKSEKDILEFIVTKNRDGSTGTMMFEFIPSTNRVVECKGGGA